MARLLNPLGRSETYRALLFYVAELGLGLVGFVLICAGWCITACFSITPLVVPLLIGLRTGVGQLARAEAALGRELLGTNTHPRATTEGRGFWDRGFQVLKDKAFWKQQGHLLLAWPIAFVFLMVLAVALEVLALPFYYHWLSGDDVFGREVDSLPEALVFVPLGLALLVALAHLLGPLTSLSRRLGTVLLAGDAEVPRRTQAEMRALRLRALNAHAGVTVAIAGVLIVIWGMTTEGYFWPMWALLPLGLVLGIHTWVVLVYERPTLARLAGGSRALAIHVGISVLLFVFLVGVWAASPGKYFWPIWPAIGLAFLAIVHVWFVFSRHAHRIDVLETTRAGAVESQEAELRRIERDLHDGAQARLVALGMSLGLAEQKLQTEPEAVRELLAEARRGAGEALEELRDLARGIHPPILTDRGLEAAVAALIAGSPVPVTLSVDLDDRPAPAVETAAYFVVSEALANAIKYGHAAHVSIRIDAVNGKLVAEIVDDGEGGADSSGPGLTGLRQRVEALDGTLRLTSPNGGPTTLRAELPCGS